MSSENVSGTVAWLLTVESDVADRDEVAVIVRASRSVRSWLDAVDVACARRSRELAAAGAAEPAESLLGDEGQRSTRDAVIINKRVPACDAMPSFEAALAAGDISGGHVDAVATVLKSLDDEIRSEFIANEAALLGAARRERVEEFLTGCRNLVRFLIAERDRRTGADTELAELERQRAASKIRQWTDKESGMHHTHVELDPVRGAKLKKALADMLRRHRATDANAGVPWNQLEVDSFLAGIDRAVTRPGHADCDHAAGDGRVETAGSPSDLRVPEIGVLVDLPTLIDGLHEHGLCETYDGTAIPLSEVRRLCCDADIIPYVFNGEGEVTDLGRSTRTVTRAQRRQLRAMHRTCVGHDCQVSFEQCQIHHIIFWRFNGRTDISNLVPVCSNHHHLAHEGGWSLTMTPDRTVTWTRPDGTVHSVHQSIDRRPGTTNRRQGDIGQVRASRIGANSSSARTTK